LIRCRSEIISHFWYGTGPQCGQVWCGVGWCRPMPSCVVNSHTGVRTDVTVAVQRFTDAESTVLTFMVVSRQRKG